METLVAEKQQKLSELLMNKLRLSFSAAKILIRKKNIKVNGKRTSIDIQIEIGDKIEVFGLKQNQNNVEIIYQDSNIIVANKPIGIEVCDGNEQTLEQKLSEASGRVFAVHRLDRNTSGLVVFAKTQEAKNELDQMFKEHRIKKFYLARVFGIMQKKSDTLVAYHKKDSNKSLVYISATEKPGYSKIVTSYKTLSSDQQTSLLEVEIATGKTHQIRAHLAFVGHALVGDDKYGSKQQNNKLKKHHQALVAYKLVFDNPHGVLEYLKGKVFELDTAI